MQYNTLPYNAMSYNTIQSIRIKYKTRQPKIRYNEVRKDKKKLKT